MQGYQEKCEQFNDSETKTSIYYMVDVIYIGISIDVHSYAVSLHKIKCRQSNLPVTTQNVELRW